MRFATTILLLLPLALGCGGAVAPGPPAPAPGPASPGPGGRVLPRVLPPDSSPNDTLVGPSTFGWVGQHSGGPEIRGLTLAGEAGWAAGRGGAWLRTTDGGGNWTVDSIPQAATLFLVDAYATGPDTAWLLGTDFNGGESRIYHTVDGGLHWSEQYRRSGTGVFFDGMAFWDGRRGLAFSDPVDGAFLIVRTDDGGRTWAEVPNASIPPPLAGEAGFAASGTAIVTGPDGRAWFGTGGGAHARVFRTTDYGRTWSVADTPLPGGATAGIFGLAFRDAQHGAAVGGDYQKPTVSLQNVLRTDDGGRTWTVAGRALPAGVRYGVAWGRFGGRRALFAVGPSGSGYSLDDGVTWTAISDEAWNTVAFDGGLGLAAGTNGRIGRWGAQPRHP